MKQTQLELKSMTEIRGLAQAIGVKFKFGDEKRHLIERIRAAVAVKLPETSPIPAMNTKTAAKPQPKYCTQDEIKAALEQYFPIGLILTFPDQEHWHVRCGFREDSGSFNMPLIDITRAVKGVLG